MLSLDVYLIGVTKLGITQIPLTRTSALCCVQLLHSLYPRAIATLRNLPSSFLASRIRTTARMLSSCFLLVLVVALFSPQAICTTCLSDKASESPLASTLSSCLLTELADIDSSSCKSGEHSLSPFPSFYSPIVTGPTVASTHASANHSLIVSLIDPHLRVVLTDWSQSSKDVGLGLSSKHGHKHSTWTRKFSNVTEMHYPSSASSGGSLRGTASSGGISMTNVTGSIKSQGYSTVLAGTSGYSPNSNSFLSASSKRPISSSKASFCFSLSRSYLISYRILLLLRFSVRHPYLQ